MTRPDPPSGQLPWRRSATPLGPSRARRPRSSSSLDRRRRCPAAFKGCARPRSPQRARDSGTASASTQPLARSSRSPSEPNAAMTSPIHRCLADIASLRGWPILTDSPTGSVPTSSTSAFAVRCPDGRDKRLVRSTPAGLDKYRCAASRRGRRGALHPRPVAFSRSSRSVLGSTLGLEASRSRASRPPHLRSHPARSASRRLRRRARGRESSLLGSRASSRPRAARAARGRAAQPRAGWDRQGLLRLARGGDGVGTRRTRTTRLGRSVRTGRSSCYLRNGPARRVATTDPPAVRAVRTPLAWDDCRPRAGSLPGRPRLAPDPSRPTLGRLADMPARCRSRRGAASGAEARGPRPPTERNRMGDILPSLEAWPGQRQ